MRAFYIGSYNGEPRLFWKPKMRVSLRADEHRGPWGFAKDPQLYPASPEEGPGVTRLVHLGGWTLAGLIVAGERVAFLFEADLDLDAAAVEAGMHFPELVGSLDFAFVAEGEQPIQVGRDVRLLWQDSYMPEDDQVTGVLWGPSWAGGAGVELERSGAVFAASVIRQAARTADAYGENPPTEGAG